MSPSLKIALYYDPKIWLKFSFKTPVEIIVLTNVLFLYPHCRWYNWIQDVSGVGSIRIVKWVDIRRNSETYFTSMPQNQWRIQGCQIPRGPGEAPWVRGLIPCRNIKIYFEYFRSGFTSSSSDRMQYYGPLSWDMIIW